MNTWKKTNEAWFGDTFDRGITLCNGELAYDTALNSDCTAIKAIGLDNNNAVTLACNDMVVGKGSNYAISANANVDTMRDRFNELQAQIDDLKKKLENKKENSELRSALKTLHYRREVE